MEHLPVEVIGNILSRLGGARDVVIASVTCRKWREASRKHLHTLAFNSNDLPPYRDITPKQLEILITQTIFQTTGLQGLSILMDDIDDVSVIHLDIGETIDNLEVVDVSNFTIIWPKFYQMISRSSKLRKLRLWDVAFDDEDEVVDLETIAVCFPQLKHLALSYELRDGVMHYGLQGSSNLENVMVLELGWTVINDLFSHWVEELLKRCPNLRKMIIFGSVSEVKSHEECQILANFTSSIVQLMRKYMNVEVHFEFE
ncbi:hypothetical protein ERO13_A07G110300v2 [Gossypium hirsutum]|nr:hypothetical protein ERO13_A07G110300v2 [Gossypium hirsutum]KAG4191680.1 hypothetical protein ERO13_A07G110300v2 [Gossypium hirsutum]